MGPYRNFDKCRNKYVIAMGPARDAGNIYDSYSVVRASIALNRRFMCRDAATTEALSTDLEIARRSCKGECRQTAGTVRRLQGYTAIWLQHWGRMKKESLGGFVKAGGWRGIWPPTVTVKAERDAQFLHDEPTWISIHRARQLRRLDRR